MATLSDARVFSASMEGGLAAEQFTSKQWSYVIDQQNGSYNGTIQFDCSSLSNNGRWVNWREAYFAIPYVMGVKSSIDVTGAQPDPHSLGFKSFLHLIDGMEIQFGNVTAQQQTPFANMFHYYKVLSTWSQDSLVKFGSLLGIAPDTARSYEYENNASAIGHGFVANRLVDARTFVSTSADTARNEGFLQRSSYHLSTGKYPVQLAASLAAGGRHRWLSTGAKDATVWYATGLAIIRLADISDFIAKLPLLKGSFLKFTLTTNTGAQDITAVAAGPTMAIASAGLRLQGRTMPIMVGSSGANNPLNAAVTKGDSTLTAAVGIGSLTIAGTKAEASPLTNCRLYVPSYQLEPSFEEQYLQSFPTKEIAYTDIYNFVTGSVANDGSIQTLLTNGIINPQYLVVVPIADSSANGTTGVFPHQSVFAAEPSGGTAGSVIDRFNVQVSGTSLFQQDYVYDFEAYQHEVASIGALNGGQDSELTSGLIDFDSWSYAYRFYVADLSRMSPADASVPKSILLMGNNRSGRATRYFCFVAFGKKLTVRVLDSTIVSYS